MVISQHLEQRLAPLDHLAPWVSVSALDISIFTAISAKPPQALESEIWQLTILLLSRPFFCQWRSLFHPRLLSSTHVRIRSICLCHSVGIVVILLVLAASQTILLAIEASNGLELVFYGLCQIKHLEHNIPGFKNNCTAFQPSNILILI